MTTTELHYLRPADLKPWPGLNPRTHFAPDAMAELVASVREKGVLQPLLVHDTDPRNEYAIKRPPWLGPRYWIVAGETRWRAATEAGVERIPCMVRVYSEAEALEVALLENVRRRDLTVLEEARGYRRWIATTGGTQAGLAERMGVAQPTIANRIRLLALPEDVLALIDEGTLTPAHARDLLLPFTKIAGAKVQAGVFATFVREIRGRGERVDANQVRAEIGRAAMARSRPISGHEWEKDPPRFDPKLHKECGCGGPKFRYSNTEEVRCFDLAWWDAAQNEAKQQTAAAEKQRAEKLRQGGGAVVEMTREEFGRRYRYDEYETLRIEVDPASPHGRLTLLDPAELAEAPLVYVDETWGGGLRCVDVDAFKRAKSAATRERNALLKERKAERAERYRQDASGKEVEPWMLVEILAVRPQNDTLLDVAREMGIDVGKHGEVYTKLRQLATPDAELFFKVLALRSRAGELSWSDPLEKAVDAELLRRYAPGLKAIEQSALQAIGRGGAEEVAPAGDESLDEDALDELSEAVEAACA